MSGPNKIANKPHMAPQGLDARAVSAGKGFMLYMIDAERNNSKGYEGLMLPNDDGSWRVLFRWGALTDSQFSGRIDGAKWDPKFANLTEREAKAALAQKYQAKTRKGYIDAWGPKHKTPDGKNLPRGQYPVGLKRNPGFAWGVQEAAFCIPALRQIQTLLAKVQDQLRGQANPSAASSLMESAVGLAKGALWAADSTMARKVLDNLSHMQGRADFIMAGDYSRIPYDKAVRDWTTALSRLMSYIDKQLSVCHGKVAAAKVARGRMLDLDWAEIVKLLGGSAFKKRPDGTIYFYKHGWGDGALIVSDNGGEVNVSQIVSLTPGSVPYWDNTKPGGMVGELTMAYRLSQAVGGRTIDYKRDLDAAGNRQAANFDPTDIGAIKKPEGDPDEMRLVEDTDQRWFSEMQEEAASPGPTWDGDGPAPNPNERVMRLAARLVASKQPRSQVERVAERWAAAQPKA